MEITEHNNLNSFLIKNEKELEIQYFEQYHLDCIVDEIYNGLVNFNIGFNITDSQTEIRMLFTKTNEWYIYGERWNQNSINVIADILRFYDLEFYILRGTRKIIQNLAKTLDLDYYESNHRVIFKSDLTSLTTDIKNPQIELGNLNDIDEIQKMHLDYYREDLPESQKTDEQLKQIVFENVKNKSLYIWRNKSGLITSKIEIINNVPNKLFFGGLYTKKEFRGKEYATKLLMNLTNYFVRYKKNECGLLTEKSNLKAQNVFINSGYKEIYHWTLGYIKSSR